MAASSGEAVRERKWRRTVVGTRDWSCTDLFWQAAGREVRRGGRQWSITTESSHSSFHPQFASVFTAVPPSLTSLFAALSKSLCALTATRFRPACFFFFSFCGNVAAVGRRGVTDVEKVFTEAHKGSQYRWGSVTFTRWRLSERRGPWDSGDRPPDTVRALYSWQVKMMKYAFLVAENTESVRRQRRCP